MVKKVKNHQKHSNTVKTKGISNPARPLVFTFSDFHLNSISIKNVFNNHFKNKDECLRKLGILFAFGLQDLSREDETIFADSAKMQARHMHKIRNKEDILVQIFNEYGFSKDKIDNIIAGGNIYQFEIPYENGSSRAVFERSDNQISFLFLDPNHHIYMNQQKTDQDDSLFFEYCPIHQSGYCAITSHLKTCFMDEFLDQEKVEQTYDYSYSVTQKMSSL